MKQCSDSLPLISMNDSLYQVGGSLTFNHVTYVERQADEDLLDGLIAGKFCYVFNCRQMGKSSLRVRAMHRLQKRGMACASVDITSLGSDINPLQWYNGLMSQLFLNLKLVGKVNLKKWIREQEQMPPIQIFGQFLEEVILGYCEAEKVFIFIDEIDKILSLPFSLDDFFSLIRYCYNQRAEDPKFNRLVFALFGVATPSDLIREKTQTPFNIGQGVELTGFTLAETDSLQKGLTPLSNNSQEIMSEILQWTGGQPFLTQKVCDLIIKDCHSFSELNPTDMIETIIKKSIINHWESQDEPVHLKTIRDRLFRQEEKAGRLLGIYQQILEKGSIYFDNSPEQTELRLSGLVVKQQDKLIPYNKIYQAVFNLDWVNQQLQKIRPYSESINAWIESNYQDKSRLLRGKALQDALFWSKEKTLGSVDYRFLSESQALEKEEGDRSRKILEKANKKATRLMQIGVGVFILSLIGAGLIIQQTSSREKTARLAIELQEDGNNALDSFQLDQIGGLMAAMEAGQQLKMLVNRNTQLENYPTTTPLLSLQQILNQIQEKNLIEAHKDAVTAVSMSPEGNYIATTSWDGTAKLWNKQGELIKTLTETKDFIYDVVFSPDGQTLITSSSDGTAKRWNLQGELLNMFKGHKKDVYRSAFSPDGQLIITTSLDATARVWTVQGELLRVLQGHNNSVDEAAFSPDGQQIITASRDGTAKLWDLEGNLLKSFSDQGMALYSVAFSPDGTKIAAAAKDGTIKLWTIADSKLQTLEGHQKLVFRVRFSPDGNRLLSASGDGTAIIWDLKGNKLNTLRVSQEPVSDIIQQGEIIATASLNGSVKLWQLSSTSDGEFNTLKRRVTRVAWSPQQNQIAIATEGGTISLWDFQGHLIQQWETDHNWIYGMNFSPDGTAIATAADRGNIDLWDLQGQTITELERVSSRVYGVRFSPDGKEIGTVAKDGRVRMINRQTKAELQVIEAHNNWIYDIDFDPISNIFVTASKDKTAKLWDQGGKLLATLEGHTDIVTHVQFSPDGQLILTASRDGTAKLWDKQGNLRKTLESDQLPVSAIRFNQAGDAIATASSDGTVRLWDLTGNLRSQYKDQAKEIVGLEFREEGKQLITVNGEGKVKFWSVKKEFEQLEQFLQQGCQWLDDYLVTRPQQQERLSACSS
ncbi:MAG: AAA-like domain-containing protein [Microcystaceae cyanobacterium]